MDKVKTGDLVLFSDLYWVTSMITRTVCWSKWTHIAMVIRFPVLKPKTIDGKDDVLILEAGHDFPCFDYLSNSKKRSGVRLISLREKMSMFHDKRRVRFVSLKPPQSACLEYWEEEIQKYIVPLLLKISKWKFCNNYYTFIRAAFNGKEWMNADMTDGNEVDTTRILMEKIRKKSNVFCSELIVIIYQYLGIMSTDTCVNPKRFNPGDFAKPNLPFLGGWSLEKHKSNVAF